MTTATTAAPTEREPALVGQTVVVIGGSSGIGLATARRARAAGADVILTGLHPDDALQRAALDLDALSTAAFDANDPAELERFFANLPKPIDHVMVTAGGPHYGRLLEMKSTSCATPSATTSCSPSKPPATLSTGSGREGRCCS